MGLKRGQTLAPVLFIDVPRKVNNPEYELLDITPFEIWIRNNTGKTHSAEKLDSLSVHWC